MYAIRKRLYQWANHPKVMQALLRVYPPYLGAGVRVVHISPRRDRVDVEMSLRPYNRNYVGTHFGGSLYTMCDPFYMLILIAQLGPDYEVWDKAATIRFRKPGKGTVRASFVVTPDQVASIVHEVDTNGRVNAQFSCAVFDAADQVVCEVDKTVYVRRKRR